MGDALASWLLKLVRIHRQSETGTVLIEDIGYVLVRATNEVEAQGMARPYIPEDSALAWSSRVGPKIDHLIGSEWRNRLLNQAEYDELDKFRKTMIARSRN